jgi:hypothetical protein
MSGFSAGETTNTIKTLSDAESARSAEWTPQRVVPAGPPNSLYKPMLLPAALACAKTGASMDIPAS